MQEIEQFLTHQEEQDATAGTIQNYQGNLRMFFEWFTEITGQPAKARNVTPLDIRQYRDSLKKGYKPGTINHKLTYLNVFFKWCVVKGYAASNPVKRVKHVNGKSNRPRWLTRQETYAVIRQAEQAVQLAQVKQQSFTAKIATRTQAIILICLNTGIRVSEVCNLLCDDIQLGERSGVLVVRYGKGNKYREIPLNADARRVISDWLKVRGGNNPYLFGTATAKQMTRQLVSWHLTELGQKVGIRLTPHVLRHTFAKSLIDSGVSIDRVSMLLGHSRLDTTMIYITPTLKDLESEVNKISWED